MLFKVAVLQRIKAGEVTLAFRRWRKPTVKAGGALNTAVGQLAIDAVDPVDDLTDAEARQAGYTDRTAALADLRAEGDLTRIAIRYLGDDPRRALRATAPDDDLALKVAAMGPWAEQALQLIGKNEGLSSADLAPRLVMDRLTFKQRIRRLKALGLTESLEVGYRLSPRGRALIEGG